MPLTDLACRNAQPGERLIKLSDSGGLQLWIQPHGSKLWRYAYRFRGKQLVLAIGVYPEVSLAQARRARESARQLLAEGIDPMASRREAQKASSPEGDTFEQVAREFLSKRQREGAAEATLVKLKWLLDFANEGMGDRPIASITAPEVLTVLRNVEARGNYSTAGRLRSTIGGVFRYAIATSRATTDPSAMLQGALISPRVTHRAAIIAPLAFGALLRAIDGYDGHPGTTAGLKLLALLVPRPGELRQAHWDEFDLDTAVWTIPATRAKLRREHKTPLSRQAIQILSDWRTFPNRGTLIFPGERDFRRPLSENTFNAALRRLGYTTDEMTSHGFRASFSSIANESRRWHPDAIERQLAHMEKNDVRAAYTRGEHWDERVAMMQWWADELDQLRIRVTQSTI